MTMQVAKPFFSVSILTLTGTDCTQSRDCSFHSTALASCDIYLQKKQNFLPPAKKAEAFQGFAF